jgi:hypothetical protein
MISGSTVCSSFKIELLQAQHNFLSDQFMIALYSLGAPLSADTTAYVTDGEISGPGYTAGGQGLTNVQVLGPSAGASYVTFDDPIWPNSSLTARGALIYNQSSGHRAVAVVDFLGDMTSNQGNFRVKLPPPGPSTAVIRLL